MKLNLPRNHFSYSQMDLWCKSKDQYRARYYENLPGFESTETIFGKRIARMLESGDRDAALDRLPRYIEMEHRVELKIGGYPFLGYFDSFSKRRKAIIEYKTGHVLWDQARVQKHDQLVIYSLLCKRAYKKTDPFIRLVWLETRYRREKQFFGSVEMEAQSNELELTGVIKIFKRKIRQWERDLMRKKIIHCMKEISDDYAEYRKNISSGC